MLTGSPKGMKQVLGWQGGLSSVPFLDAQGGSLGPIPPFLCHSRRGQRD